MSSLPGGHQELLDLSVGQKVFYATIYNRVSSVKRRSLEFRECARQPKAHSIHGSFFSSTELANNANSPSVRPLTASEIWRSTIYSVFSFIERSPFTALLVGLAMTCAVVCDSR